MSLGTGNQFEGAVKPDAITKEAYEPDLFALRYCEIPTNLQMRLDYGSRTDGQPDYQGFAPRGLTTSQDGWLIYKFTYSGDPGSMTVRQIAYDAWDNRGTTASYA